jgi:hypothetical protein
VRVAVAADEDREVFLNRSAEAIRAGLSVDEARAFAHSGVDIGLLRRLLAEQCPLALIRRIVL